MTTEDMEAKSEKINRCSICQVGFVNIGNLSSEKRLEDHLGTTRDRPIHLEPILTDTDSYRF